MNAVRREAAVNPDAKPYQLRPDGFFNRRLALPDHHDAENKPVLYRRSPVEWGRRAECGGAASAAAPLPGLSKNHNAPHPARETCQVELWRGAHLIQVRRPAGPSMPPTGKRGGVNGFSARSRQRLMVTVNRVAMSTGALPHFVTCTFPDEVPTPAEVVRILDVFCRRLERDFAGVGLIWKKELKRRLSGRLSVGKVVPHFHALTWNLPEVVPLRVVRGRWVKQWREPDGWVREIYERDKEGGKVLLYSERQLGNTQDVRRWLSFAWYEAVGSGDFRHFLAGTNLSRVESVKGVRFFVSKHMSKAEEGTGEWANGRW